MILLYIILSVVAYGAIAGFLQPLFQRYNAAMCSNCSTGKKYYLRVGEHGEPGDGHDSYGLAALWPFIAPFVLMNMLTSDKYKRGDKAVQTYHERKAIEAEKQYLEELERSLG